MNTYDRLDCLFAYSMVFIVFVILDFWSCSIFIDSLGLAPLGKNGRFNTAVKALVVAIGIAIALGLCIPFYKILGY